MESFKSIKLEWVLESLRINSGKLRSERITYVYLTIMFVGWFAVYQYLLRALKGKLKVPGNSNSNSTNSSSSNSNDSSDKNKNKNKSNNKNNDNNSKDDKQPQPKDIEVELSDEEFDIECRTISYDIFAFSATLFMGVMGSLMWYGFYGNVDHFDRNIYTRNDTVTQYIVIPMACYQFWNFLTCLLIPEYRKFIPLLHHIAGFFLAFACMEPVWSILMCFYFGLCEISTCVTSVICFFQRPVHAKLKLKYSGLNMICEIFFAVSFMFFRIILNYKIITDYFTAHNQIIRGEYMLEDGNSLVVPSGSSLVNLWMVWLCGVTIALIQVHYLQIIFGALFAKLGGSTEDSKDKKE